jgi:hypothetical protein
MVRVAHKVSAAVARCLLDVHGLLVGDDLDPTFNLLRVNTL